MGEHARRPGTCTHATTTLFILLLFLVQPAWCEIPTGWVSFDGSTLSPRAPGIEYTYSSIETLRLEVRTPGVMSTAEYERQDEYRDFDRMRHGVCTAAVRDSARVQFDVTDMVAAWIGQEAENHGMIVAVSPRETAYIEAARETQGPQLRSSQLRIWYTPRRD